MAMFPALHEFLHLVGQGTISDLVDELRALNDKDVAAIEASAANLLADFGLRVEADQLRTLSQQIKDQNDVGVTLTILDMLKSIILLFAPKPPVPVTQDAAPPVSQWKKQQALTYLADHKGDVRDGAKHPAVRLLFRSHPEVLAFIGGTATAEQVGALNPDTVEKIMIFIERIIPILTIISVGVPYLLPVVVVLKIIDTFYRANHPLTVGDDQTGLSLVDVNTAMES